MRFVLVITIITAFSYLMGRCNHCLARRVLSDVIDHQTQSDITPAPVTHHLINPLKRTSQFSRRFCSQWRYKHDNSLYGIEWMTMAYWVLFLTTRPLSIHLFLQLIASSVLIVLAIIDSKTFLLPDRLTLPLLWCGLLQCSLFNSTALSTSLWSCMAGYMICWILHHAYWILRNKNGLGLGDAKLCAVIGAWYGFDNMIGVLFTGALTALVVVATRYLYQPQRFQQPFAFGPYLVIATLLNNYFFLQ